MGQFPQFLEALPPGIDVGWIVENERAARLIDMETADAMALVGQHVRIRQMTQVVRALSHVDDMRKAGNELHQARRIALHGSGIVQHHADSAQAAHLQKACQRLKACFFFEPQGGKIAIENRRPGGTRLHL